MQKKDLFEIGQRLKSYRQAQGYSQEELADKVDISLKFYGMIERGERGMSLDTLLKLVKILKIDTEYLLFGEITDHDIPIMQMLSELSPPEQKYAEEILLVFLKSLENLKKK